MQHQSGLWAVFHSLFIILFPLFLPTCKNPMICGKSSAKLILNYGVKQTKYNITEYVNYSNYS